MRLRSFVGSYDYYLLLEASKYDGMFGGIVAIEPNSKTNIDSVINWARQTLQREDRIIWFLRWYRLMYLQIVMSWANQQHPNYESLLKFFNKYSAEMTKLTGKPVQLGGDALRNLQGELSHFLSLPIQGIQNLQFSNQTVEDLIAQMEQLEDQWKQENSSKEQYLEPQYGDKIFIQFDDGWAWWLLDRMYCSAEGKAMGHCGNAGSPKPNDRILSLRKQTARGWRPSLTFILDQNGMLGEMKGRNNDKPQPAYHPYIVTLLQHDQIKGIVGGGYMPEHNFEMSDLPEEQQNQLSEAKPALASAAFIFKKFGPTPEFVAKIISEITSKTGHEIEWDDTTKLFVVEKFKDVDEFMDMHGDETARHLAASFKGDNDMFNDWDYPVDDDDAKRLLDDLPRELQQRICIYAQNTYGTAPDEEEDEEVDWADTSDVWQVLVGNDDEIVQIMKNSVADGHRIGAESEAYNAFNKALQDPFQGTNSSYLQVHYTMYTSEHDGKQHIQHDEPCSLTITPQEAVTISQDQDMLDSLGYEGWVQDKIEVSEPHYGWSGYDEKAAIENAADQLSGMV